MPTAPVAADSSQSQVVHVSNSVRLPSESETAVESVQANANRNHEVHESEPAVVPAAAPTNSASEVQKLTLKYGS